MILRLLTLASLALLIAAAPAQAAKADKGKKGGARVLARFDRDHNGTIDGQESVRLQASFAALTALDIDSNGQLSDTEIAAAKIPMSKKGGKKKKTE